MEKSHFPCIDRVLSLRRNRLANGNANAKSGSGLGDDSESDLLKVLKEEVNETFDFTLREKVGVDAGSAIEIELVENNSIDEKPIFDVFHYDNHEGRERQLSALKTRIGKIPVLKMQENHQKVKSEPKSSSSPSSCTSVLSENGCMLSSTIKRKIDLIRFDDFACAYASTVHQISKRNDRIYKEKNEQTQTIGIIDHLREAYNKSEEKMNSCRLYEQRAESCLISRSSFISRRRRANCIKNHGKIKLSKLFRKKWLMRTAFAFILMECSKSEQQQQQHSTKNDHISEVNERGQVLGDEVDHNEEEIQHEWIYGPDDRGRPYYYNVITGHSSWEPPYINYDVRFNPTSGESEWQIPPEIDIEET